ncbi:glycoside hydrolase family 10 protein [Roseofilum casamattae]|uniref:Family 10 glycosylhydrolase n=1 Tax=Roseofilum casamattae BLCC-M143 TaxID=3022442 RepID=A0ABT7BXB6_9CYAN|nr:family 10 glycosylhydrolase [Roseofilum casamattae]MDJ1183111.1 family 10 glycosylhydrolase [Roseofilum casamattae BLCC-M143]
MRQIIITWRKQVFLAIAIVLLAIAPTLSQPTSAQAPAKIEDIQEIRGVWLTNVSSAVLYSPWGIERALSQLAELKFNTVYPVAWNRGVTFYPSETAEKAIGRNQDFTLGALRPGKDTLDEMIFIGHQKGLRIIPWFEYGFMAPQNSLLVKRHPSWLAQPRNSVALTHHGKYGLEWLNPLHPEVQQLLIDLIAEVVTRYDVDGIQLDDHFSLPVELGYDPFTTWLYQQEHQGETPPENYENAEWMRWRANKLTQVMQRIHDRIKEIKPDCIISLSPNPHQYAYRKYLQDWPTWVNQGLVDEVVVQVYRSGLDSFQRDLNLNNDLLTKLQQKIPVAIGISSGTVRTPISINLIEEQVKAVRDRGFDGFSFFYWESLWGYITPESPHVRRRGFENLW